MARSRAVRPVAVGAPGFDGDAVADYRVGGGPAKAVHCNPAEHYAAHAPTWAATPGLPCAVVLARICRHVD